MNKSHKPYTLQLGSRDEVIAQSDCNAVRLRKIFWQSLVLAIPYIKILWYQNGIGYRTFELIDGKYQLTGSIGALCGVSEMRKAV